MRLTRILCCFTIITLLGSSPVLANVKEDGIQVATATLEERIGSEEQEKATSYAADIDTNKLKNWPQGPNVYAGAGVVMDMDSGAILFGKNIHNRYYPASITKLLTVLVALENAELSERIKFSEDSVSFLQSDYAQIGMKAGEELSLEDSLYAILLASANEVAYAVAENVGTKNLGGNYDTFIQKMNDRAKELGCINSSWANPHGLHDDNHYTTAHDMALIAAAVSKREEFQKIMGTLEYKIGPTNMTGEERIFQQNHKMLWPENYYYNDVYTGGKTGYTDQSKTTLVTMADNGQMKLAAVTLYDYGLDAYEDTKNMLDYGFQSFNKVLITGLETSKDIKELKREDSFVTLPEKVKLSDLKERVVLKEKAVRDGILQYTYEGHNVGSAEATLSEEGYQRLSGNTPTNKGDNVKDKKDGSRDKDGEGVGGLKFYIATGIAGLLLFVTLKRFAYYERRKRRRRRRRVSGRSQEYSGVNRPSRTSVSGDNPRSRVPVGVGRGDSRINSRTGSHTSRTGTVRRSERISANYRRTGDRR